MEQESDGMSRNDEVKQLSDQIEQNLESIVFDKDLQATTIMTIMIDIAQSLAIIADKLTEGNEE